MAKTILSKRTPKLNLTPQQTAVFQKIILIGNQMAEMLGKLEHQAIQPKAAKELADQWGKLMVKLVKLLI